jgi:hypothetical protein
MQVSEEFSQFCSGLHQDLELYGPTPQDWVRGALDFVPRERWPALRAYLDQLLAGGYSDAQLQQVYRDTLSELAFWDDRDVRRFLTMARDTIDRNS